MRLAIRRCVQWNICPYAQKCRYNASELHVHLSMKHSQIPVWQKLHEQRILDNELAKIRLLVPKSIDQYVERITKPMEMLVWLAQRVRLSLMMENVLMI